MKNPSDNEEKKSQENYTQFNFLYQKRFNQDLELNKFQTITDIGQKKINETKLSLRAEDAKILNIRFANDNNFSDGKNIKKILSNECEKAYKYDNIYDNDTPEFFNPPPLILENLEKPYNVKNNSIEEKNPINDKTNNINKIGNDYDIDIDINSAIEEEKEISEINKNVGLKNENNENIQDNNIINDIITDNNKKYENNKKEKENDDFDDNNEINYDTDFKLFFPDEQDFKEEAIFEKNKNKEIIQNEINEKDNKTINDNYEIEIENESLLFDQNLNTEETSKFKEKNKHKNKKIKNRDSNNNSESDFKTIIANQITTLNIKGLNSNEYYLGEIIEKGPNFPSTLGIVKYMNLILFSENYFGEILKFDEISKKNDFQKIIRLIPVGNKKYIFSDPSSSQDDIIREENDLIILHGKGGQETFYYIMKLTGQINGNSEYTIYKVNNNKQIIRHFKDSVGLDIGENKEVFDNNELVTEGITYDIVENPNIKYLVMSGQQFLTKYRKLMKKEKEMEEKKKIIEDKNYYNLNFENNFSQTREKYNKLINEKKIEIEQKLNYIKDYKLDISILNEKEQKTNNIIRQREEEKNRIKRIEEQMKIKMSQVRKRYNDALRLRKGLENDNIKVEKDFDDNKNEVIPENEEELNKEKEKLNKLKEKLKKLKGNIYCCECNEKRKEVIFNCRHLMICKDCLQKYKEDGNKIKAKCPLCKNISKRLFFIQFEE